MKLFLMLAMSAIVGCSSAKRNDPAASAGFSDSITFAYIPTGMASFAGYAQYRENDDVIQETGFIDYGVRNNDFASVEVGPENFPLLQALGGKESFTQGEVAALPFVKGKLLLFVATGDSSYSTAGTRAKDILKNTLAIAGASPGSVINLSKSKEYRHKLRAIYLDPSTGRFLDTTSVLAKTGDAHNGWPKMGDGETLPYHHYISVIKAIVKR